MLPGRKNKRSKNRLKKDNLTFISSRCLRPLVAVAAAQYVADDWSREKMTFCKKKNPILPFDFGYTRPDDGLDDFGSFDEDIASVDLPDRAADERCWFCQRRSWEWSLKSAFKMKMILMNVFAFIWWGRWLVWTRLDLNAEIIGLDEKLGRICLRKIIPNNERRMDEAEYWFRKGEIESEE